VSGELVTAATVRREQLDPLLEGIGQNRLQFNPTPDLDSLLELQREALLRSPPGRMQKLALTINERLIASNSLEGQQERRVAGFTDQLVRDLRDTELNGAASSSLNGKAIARQLRPPLQQLAGAPTPDARAFLAIAELTRSLPRATLLAPAVRRELGDELFAALHDLVQMRNGAGRLETSGAATPRAGSRHGEI
jgi:hypothetical protein